MPISVRLRGPFTGPSGYDHHVREFARAIAARGVRVELENIADWGPVQLPHNLRDPWFESLTQPVGARTTVHFCFPDQVPPGAPGVNLNFTMFEATRVAPRWATAHVNADLVIVPTQHSRQAWVDSGVPAPKLRLCPLGVRGDLFRPGVRPLALDTAGGRPVSSYATRFLNVAELGARKNLAGLLSAWLRATTPADDAVLILKLGAYNPGSLLTFESHLAEVQRNVGKDLAQAAPVHTLYDLFADADMPRLYATATHYLSLSLGEGWDLAMIEAASSGLRLIAPRHSAYTAYLDDDIAAFVGARAVPAVNPTGEWISDLFEGAHWWQPDEDEAIERIKDAIVGRDAGKPLARERIARDFTWDAAAERLLAIVDEAEATAR